MELAASHELLAELDFSRFDGHINEPLRELVEFACYRRWVAKEHLEELDGLLRSEIRPRAAQREVKYAPGCTRLSGSPLTTDGNTLINAFCQYATLRSAGYPADASYQKLGLLYGDDGVVGENGVGKGLRVAVARNLGLKLKILATPTVGEPVGFIGRVFVDPWTSPASVQDPERTLLKINTTTDAQSELVAAGRAKTNGYLITDGQTPLISEWCRAYQRNAAEAEELEYSDVPWFSNIIFRDQPWPQDYAATVPLVASRLGISVSTLVDHCAALVAYTGTTDAIPVLELPKKEPKLDVILDGEIQRAGPSIEDQHTEIKHETTRKDDDNHGTTPRDGVSERQHDSRNRASGGRRRSRGGARHAADGRKETSLAAARPTRTHSREGGEHSGAGRGGGARAGRRGRAGPARGVKRGG